MKKTILLKLKIIFLFIIIVSCNSKTKKVQLSLPAVFSDHMVLQQKSDVVFWGKSSPNDKIILSGSWGESNSIKANDTGNWELKLSTPSAGGPYEVKVNSSKNSIKYKDVLIGEVWLASGQSNMDWKLNQCKSCIDNQEQEIANANYNQIRFFNNPMDLSRTIVKSQKWRTVTPELAAEMSDTYGIESFSATGYFFARELYNEINVPIGIIASSWGGTRVEAWTSRKKLSEMTSVKLPLISQKQLSIKDRDELQQYYKNYNDSVAKLNNKLFGFKTFDLPKLTEEPWLKNLGDKINPRIEDKWKKLILNDKEYSRFDYDDSKWKKWVKNYEDPGYPGLSGRFENIFDSKNEFLTNGTFWFRTEIDLKDISTDYELILEEGADDTDQTFFNGKLIGNTFSYSKERKYLINKSLLKKGKNVLAIRLTDTGGPGGFNGRILLQNNKNQFEISMENFKYKHQAFIINGKLVIHNLSEKDLIEKSDYLKENIVRGFAVDTPEEYSILYDRILSNIIPYTVKGVIWYQGEANVINYNEYQTLFSGMIDDWRDTWGYDFPFYYVQLHPFTDKGNLGIREAQRKTLESTKKTGMAILMDIGEEDDIHPQNKQDVGKRLALIALDKDYGFDIVSSGPLYKNHKNFKKYIDVDFNHKGSGLISKGKLKDFEIAGSDGIFYKASAKIINNKVRVFSSKVINPKHIRYGWKNWVMGSLFNKEGLPASSFSSKN